MLQKSCMVLPYSPGRAGLALMQDRSQMSLRAPVLSPSSCTTFLHSPEPAFKSPQALNDHHPPKLHFLLPAPGRPRGEFTHIPRHEKALQTSPSSFRGREEKKSSISFSPVIQSEPNKQTLVEFFYSKNIFQLETRNLALVGGSEGVCWYPSGVQGM